MYPGEPAVLRVLLPFRTVNENFQYCREAYVAGGLLHRCSVNDDWENRRVQFQRDASGKTVIHSGVPVKVCNGEEVGQYKKRDGTGEVVPVFCKPVGRLKVILPQLQRMVFFTVLTSSIHDIENLRGELQAYENMGPKGLAGIPLILKRVPRKISTPSKEGRVRREKWLIHVEVDPSWAAGIFKALTDASMPEQAALEAPKNIQEGEWAAEEEPEPEEFSKARIDDNFGVEEGETKEPEIVYPANLDATVLYAYAKKIGRFAEAQSIMKELKLDVRKSWEALLKGFVPPEEWGK
jgi:hypothetical protein